MSTNPVAQSVESGTLHHNVNLLQINNGFLGSIVSLSRVVSALLWVMTSLAVPPAVSRERLKPVVVDHTANHCLMMEQKSKIHDTAGN